MSTRMAILFLAAEVALRERAELLRRRRIDFSPGAARGESGLVESEGSVDGKLLTRSGGSSKKLVLSPVACRQNEGPSAAGGSLNRNAEVVQQFPGGRWK
jgi:hypothetical protein